MAAGVAIVVKNPQPLLDAGLLEDTVSDEHVIELLNDLHAHQIRRQADDDVTPFWNAAHRYLARLVEAPGDAVGPGVSAVAYTRARRALESVLRRRSNGELPSLPPKGKLSREHWVAAFRPAPRPTRAVEVTQAPPADAARTPLILIGPMELLQVPAPPRWLIADLWVGEGVGIIGAAPKSYKTWIALEMALAVSSGTPCFGRFGVPEAGPVIAFFAEDSLAAIRERILAVCIARGLDLERLPFHLVSSSTLRLDSREDQERLRDVIAQIRPRLVVLDPLVRLHAGDENDSGHIGRLLGFLRSLQRDFGTAIVLTHHNRKTHSIGAPEGQGLRGSGDLHAWTDTGLFLRRRSGVVTLRVEHRSAASPEPMQVSLARDPAPHIEVVTVVDEDDGAPSPVRDTDSLEERVHQAIEGSSVPLARAALRELLRCRNESLTSALRALAAKGTIRQDGGGWVVADTPAPPAP